MAHSAAHASSAHIIPQKVLLRTFILLVVLMVLTVGAARVQYAVPQLQQMWVLNNIIALTIAIVKAYLVVTIFMGVKFTSRLVQVFAIGGFVWFLLLFLMLMDYWSRPTEPVPGWESTPSSALPRNRERAE